MNFMEELLTRLNTRVFVQFQTIYKTFEFRIYALRNIRRLAQIEMYVSLMPLLLASTQIFENS